MEVAMLLTGGRVETLSLLSAPSPISNWRRVCQQQRDDGFPNIIKLDNYLFSGHMSDNDGRPSVATNHTVKLIHN